MGESKTHDINFFINYMFILANIILVSCKCFKKGWTVNDIIVYLYHLGKTVYDNVDKVPHY